MRGCGAVSYTHLAWDALTDAQKELVEGENADPDYFGKDTGDASKDDPLNEDEIGENEDVYKRQLCEHEDDIICHSGCDDMADVARYYLEESGQLGELSAHLQNYIDYAAYGRDMELDGTFVITNHGVYEILR